MELEINLEDAISRLLTFLMLYLNLILFFCVYFDHLVSYFLASIPYPIEVGWGITPGGSTDSYCLSFWADWGNS